MTIEKCIEEIQNLTIPFYLEPSKKEIIHVVMETRNELEVYKKALEMACKDIAKSHPILSALGYNYYQDRYLQKARKENGES